MRLHRGRDWVQLVGTNSPLMAYSRMSFACVTAASLSSPVLNSTQYPHHASPFFLIPEGQVDTVARSSALGDKDTDGFVGYLFQYVPSLMTTCPLQPVLGAVEEPETHLPEVVRAPIASF